MGFLVTWSGHDGISFFVSADEIRAIKDFGISTASEVEEIKSQLDGSTWKKKNVGNYELTLTVMLNAALGVDVQAVATAMSEAARNAEKGYFYVGEAKLFPCQFMAMSAKISDLRMSGSGKWLRCEVTWTLKQDGKFEVEKKPTTTTGRTRTKGNIHPDITEPASETTAAAASQPKSGSSGSGTGTAKKQTSGTDLLDVAMAAAKEAALAKALQGVLGTTSAAKRASAASYAALTGRKTTTSGNLATALTKTGRIVK